MSPNVDCGNHDALADYLYDECEPEQRAAVAAHLATCQHCLSELESLRETRLALAAWTPPEAELGFRVVASGVSAGVSTGGTVLRPARWWHRPMPAWAQAAAAALIFAAGLGLGAMRGVTLGPPDLRTSGPSDRTPAPSDLRTVSADDLAALEQRLRSEMQAGLQQVRATAPASAPAGAAPMTSSPTLQQVRALIAESEQRQQRELTLRTAEVIRDFDTQRRGDLARIQQTFGRLEGATGAEVEQQRQMLNYLMRVAQRPAQ
jgi:hypothetical protein